MANRKTITLSFSEYDLDIYEFLKSQSNASAYVRRLVLSQMTNINAPIPTEIAIEQSTQANVQVVVEPPVEEAIDVKPKSIVPFLDDDGFDDLDLDGI